MTQFDNPIQSNHTGPLRHMLYLIAQSQDIETVVPVILEEAQTLIEADAAFYLLLDAPRVLITQDMDEILLPEDDWFKNHVATLTEQFHISDSLPQTLKSEFHTWILYPLKHKKKLLGIFVLLYKNPKDISEEKQGLLLSLVDAATILTSTTRTEARYQKLMHNQNEFVRIVSHDLRSPLTSMKGFASMLESKMVGNLNDKQVEDIGKILNGIEQMTSLVDNIQDAGRYDPETGFYEMERTHTDLADMVNRIVNNLIVPTEKQELMLSVSAADNVPIVYVDANMLERSVTNLVDNAIKYTPDGGEVEVRVEVFDDNVEITVNDNGYGISEENLRQLFKRHFRIRRREHKRVKGSGLGLFIVRSVALQHGGDAFVESMEGEGSTFGIRIPLSPENLFATASRNSSDDE